jgi:hypothetical protein
MTAIMSREIRLASRPHGFPSAGTAPPSSGLPNANGGTYAIALVPDAHDFRLCHGLMPDRERHCEGRYERIDAKGTFHNQWEKE